MQLVQLDLLEDPVPPELLSPQLLLEHPDLLVEQEKMVSMVLLEPLDLKATLEHPAHPALTALPVKTD